VEVMDWIFIFNRLNTMPTEFRYTEFRSQVQITTTLTPLRRILMKPLDPSFYSITQTQMTGASIVVTQTRNKGNMAEHTVEDKTVVLH